MKSTKAWALIGCLAACATSLGCDKKETPAGAASATSSARTPAIPPSSSSAGAAPGAAADGGAATPLTRVEFPEVPIRAAATTTVHVAWKTPPGTGVNEDAPFKVRWHHSDALAEAPADVKATGIAARDGFRIAVKPLDGAPNATLSGVIDLVVCDTATHAVCVPVRRTLDIEFVIGKLAAAETTVTVDLPQAKPQ